MAERRTIGQIRSMLAESIKGVVSQVLLRKNHKDAFKQYLEAEADEEFV